jgi:putative lipase involved disintegration of autophagic bodies
MINLFFNHYKKNCFYIFGMTKRKLTHEELKHALDGSYSKKTEDKGDLKVDKSLSGQRVKVYTKDGKVIVSHRGTSSAKDIYNDAMYTMGMLKHTKRYKHSERIQREAEKKYAGKEITTVGHSLGGALAERVAKKKGRVITFNKADTSLFNSAKRKNQVDLKTERDVVGLNNHRKKILRTGEKNIFKAHKLDQLDHPKFKKNEY